MHAGIATQEIAAARVTRPATLDRMKRVYPFARSGAKRGTTTPKNALAKAQPQLQRAHSRNSSADGVSGGCSEMSVRRTSWRSPIPGVRAPVNILVALAMVLGCLCAGKRSGAAGALRAVRRVLSRVVVLSIAAHGASQSGKKKNVGWATNKVERT